MNLTKQNLHLKAFLGIDYGKRQVGLALYTAGIDPRPYAYSVLMYKNDLLLSQEIKKIVLNESIDYIILGNPLHEDRRPSLMTQRIIEFQKVLLPMASVPVLLQDEFGSSQDAQEYMRNSPLYNFEVDPKKLDAVAATFILERFIQDLPDA